MLIHERERVWEIPMFAFCVYKRRKKDVPATINWKFGAVCDIINVDNRKDVDMDIKKKLNRLLVPDMKGQVDKLTTAEATTLYDLINIPGLRVRPDRKTVPYGLNIGTNYGTIQLDASLTKIKQVYVNSARFVAKDTSLHGLSTLIKGDASENLEPADQFNNRRRSRGRRVRSASADLTTFDDVRDSAYEDLASVNLTYENLYQELGSIMGSTSDVPEDVMGELIANKVPEDEIAKFIAYESDYNKQIIGQLYGVNYGDARLDYKFSPLNRGEHLFADKVLDMLGVEEAEYDARHGALRIGDRLITNLPEMDERGVFSTRGTKYIPYHIGYFAEGEGTRVERLRHIDPVAEALNAVKLQYELSSGDIKFKALLDVSRNLPDFDKHPYGAEILDTYKRKVVFDKNYLKTNSLLAEYQGNTDDLGAVALTMLDDDAKGLIDPYGTSNGSNMGAIFYLTQDAQFNEDGTFTKGTKEHSLVGDYIKAGSGDKDNFNRNQMSFHMMLTSTNVVKVKMAVCEFSMYNAEDAFVMSKKGAEKFKLLSEDGEIIVDTKEVGDKASERHGNKSTASIIIDPEMDDETAKEERLTHAVEFMRLNPDVDIITSPISIASRMNMGVLHECLRGEKQDLHLPSGEVVKDAIVEIEYMSLPQTADHKAKDYAVEGSGRKYSNLYRHVVGSKVGEELYRQAYISEKVRDEHISEVVTAFERQGISFGDNKQLVKRGNVQLYVDAPIEIDAEMYAFNMPHTIRLSLQNQMKERGTNQANILLGDKKVYSPMTGMPIVDSQGRNVLPIRLEPNGGIPYRYNNVFRELALGNENKVREAYSKVVAIDFKALTRKNNLLKNIDTMTFHEGARTEVLTIDPRLSIKDCRTTLDTDRLIAHRDPAIQSGNAISFNNVGGGTDNVIKINPLILVQIDGDCDGDTMGVLNYLLLNLTDEQKQEFFEKSCVVEQLNKYGTVFLGTGSGHFKALALANGLDTSDITFADGKSNAELADIVDGHMRAIVDSPKSYGAYAVSFTDEKTALESLGRLADDGIKGNRQDMENHFYNGYTADENRAVMKALIAKSEWTGLAGAITNDLIAGFSKFDPELIRPAMDITYTMTQSVLQMKKNADKLTEIDGKIALMKTVMSGKFDVETSRQKLYEVTEGLVPQEAVDIFVDRVAVRQTGDRFGQGVFNNQDLSTNKLAYTASANFGRSVMKVAEMVDNAERATGLEANIEIEPLTQEEMDAIMEEFAQQYI